MSYPQLCNIPYQNQPDLLRKIKNTRLQSYFFFPQSFDKEKYSYIFVTRYFFKRLHYGEKRKKRKRRKPARE